MAVQTQTPDIAADGVVRIDARTGAPALPTGSRQAAIRTTLTCTWVTVDGALVMRWTTQAAEGQRAQMTLAAA